MPVAKKDVAAYRRIARKAGKVWKDHGALEFRECVGGRPQRKNGCVFPRSMKRKRGETVFFSWIVFKSRTQRDRVNAKVMKDPRIANADMTSMPMDSKRMLYGGFKVLVDL